MPRLLEPRQPCHLHLRAYRLAEACEDDEPLPVGLLAEMYPEIYDSLMDHAV